MSKLPLFCPNKCEVDTILHEDMEAHRKECPLEMIQCEYHNVGCEERMMRKDLEQHNNNKMTRKHLSLTESSLRDTKSQLDALFDQINILMILMYQSAMT